MHRFVITGQREDSSEIYNDFISRRDPQLDGPQGYDPLIDRFGLQPSKRTIVVAAELEPIEGENEKGRKIIEGWELAIRQYKNKDDEDVEVPNIALVVESPHTFYAQMFNLVDMGEDFSTGIYAVLRSGKGTDTTYTFKCVGEALDLSEELQEFEAQFDLDAWLEELADEDRIHELIDAIPDGAVVSKFPPKGKAKKGEAAAKKKPATSSRSRRAKVEEPEDEPDEPEADPGPEPEPDEPESDAADEETAPEEKPKTRARRFSDLKKPSKR